MAKHTKPFRCQPHKMVKPTQTICRQQPMSALDHFVGLAIKGLNLAVWTPQDIKSIFGHFSTLCMIRLLINTSDLIIDFFQFLICLCLFASLLKTPCIWKDFIWFSSLIESCFNYKIIINTIFNSFQEFHEKPVKPQ